MIMQVFLILDLAKYLSGKKIFRPNSSWGWMVLLLSRKRVDGDLSNACFVSG